MCVVVADEPLPNLFVVGVPRGGTTSLWYYLGQHPDIFMSDVKEPYYFSYSHDGLRESCKECINGGQRERRRLRRKAGE